MTPLAQVATVLTVYGIETQKHLTRFRTRTTLQQYLPFTVLKLADAAFISVSNI